MSRTPRTVYLVMSVWLLLGSTVRIVLFLRQGIPVDLLPVTSILLGLVALVLAFRPHPAPSTPAR